MKIQSSSVQKQQSSIALLVFSRTAEEEARIKSLGGAKQPQAERQIADRLIQHTLKEARKSGLPVITAFSHEQQGANFGQRFSHAFQAAYAQGYQQVIAIGNDCPSLTRKDLQAAARQLSSGQSVLGPSTDGGAYLLGFDQANFDAANFESLPWETAQLWDELVVWSQQKATVQTLQKLTDIDHQADLDQWLRKASPLSDLAQSLKSILASWQPALSKFVEAYISSFHASFQPLRGPPAING